MGVVIEAEHDWRPQVAMHHWHLF